MEEGSVSSYLLSRVDPMTQILSSTSKRDVKFYFDRLQA